jgi:ABC-2 type transport system permease protein
MSPRIILANLVVRLKSFSREKSAMFFTVLFPVILVLVFGAIFTKPEQLNIDLRIQDLDGTKASRELYHSFEESGIFKLTQVPSQVDARDYARENKVNLVVVIPKGYEANQMDRIANEDDSKIANIRLITDPSSTSLTSKLALVNAGLAKGNQRMTGIPEFFIAKEESILDRKYRFIEFFVPGIIAMAIMTSSLSGALNANAELVQKGIRRKLATTPISHVDWMLTNVCYHIILGAISTIAILLVAYFVYDVHLTINFWLPIFIVLEVFVFVGLGMILTPIAKEAESASAAGNALLFPMMFLSGSFFPVEMMPLFLQKFARVLPLYYLNEGLRSAMIFLDTTVIYRCLAITAGVAVVVFLLGAVTTRWDKGT